MKTHTTLIRFLLLFLMVTSCDAIKKIGGKKPNLSLNFFSKPEPITTSFDDVSKEKVLPDDFGNNLTPLPMDEMARGDKGGFLLSSGLYEMTCKSYCLHPGYGSPGKGDGYLFAPLKGDKTDIIKSILQNAETKDAWQQDVQALIWAILSSTSFDNLSPTLQKTGRDLLSKKQIYELNKGAIGVLPPEVIQKAQQNMPPAVRKAMELQNKMRGAFADANTKYEDLEKLAVPPAATTNDRPEYKKGRWSMHPDGYYIRYFPDGYRATRMQVYVPKPSKPINSGKQNSNSFYRFTAGGCANVDPAGQVAVPANSAQQRLATSSQPKDKKDPTKRNDVGKQLDSSKEVKEVVNWGGNSYTIIWRKTGSVVDFGDRSQLANILGSSGKGGNIEAHHIIPWVKGGGHAVTQKGAENGFHLNHPVNMIGLEKYTKLTGTGLHGNHPAYDNFITFRLDNFEKANPCFSPTTANNYLQNQLIPELKTQIIKAKNSGLNLNEYFKQVVNKENQVPDY
jgi:hypothetical protein